MTCSGVRNVPPAAIHVSAIASDTTGTVYARGVTTTGYRSAISKGTTVVAEAAASGD